MAVTSHRRRGGSIGYAQVATSVLFDSASVVVDGLAGTHRTDVARVYDQYNALMVPQPAGAMSYASDTPAVATVNGSTGEITSVTNGTAVITATFTPS